MVAQFDVAGSVRLKDVSRPAAGETPVQAIARLAAKAKIEGIRLLMESDTEEIFATSSTMESIIYRVSAAGCSCQGFARFGRCKHHSLYLVENGSAPTDPEPSATAAEGYLAAKASLDRLEWLMARGGIKTTGDWHHLHAARRRVEELSGGALAAVA